MMTKLYAYDEAEYSSSCSSSSCNEKEKEYEKVSDLPDEPVLD
jgi:hypothetical protein